MTTQLLVESRDAAQQSGRLLRAAAQLATAGIPTVVFLVDEGVRSARGSRLDLARAVRAGASIRADKVSLAERNIPGTQLAPGVVAASVDEITSLLCDPDVKVVWH
ncbi:dehydroquinate synthase/iron-containing alcohol dehydrogenase family protein [Amycolatopsis aidingensis]|uniref:hypothetical protein n=1 Tax=Amycolatopsis aidingensis TaxID=2842453 RepID=UPI001C0AC61E|nr:hypothetical protein [Amycolatopsis aidingensis]